MIRPARRGGPPPFQVMSNTWRAAATNGGGAQPAEKPQAPISPKPMAGKPKQERTGSSLLSRFISVIASGVASLVDGGTRAGVFVASRCNRWFSGSVGNTPLSRKYVAIGLVAFVALVSLIAMLGDGGARQGDQASPSAVSPGNVDTNLIALQAIQGGATPPVVGIPAGPKPPDPAVASGSRNPSHAAGATGAAAPNAGPSLVKGKADPREKGKRYYVLGTYSVNKEELMLPMLQYLWGQGVEVGAFNAHNSRFYQVIALQGFTREEVNAGAHRKYEEALRRIGRKWKSDGGGDDLRGLYLDEYKGADINLSITKAN